MKTIVTHIGPDLDAITSVWLVKTYFPGWQEAAIAFVPAGSTLNKAAPDADPDIIHVDTGFGKFDHHQTDDFTCASRLVYEEIAGSRKSDPAMERLIALVTDIDHFREVYYPNPTADIWELTIVGAIDGWRLIYSEDPQKIMQLGMETLDGIYKTLKNKVWAEKEIMEKGREFLSPWGNSLAVETVNDEVVHLAQKMGYLVVVRKDPKKGYVRIKAYPKAEIDLTGHYRLLSEKDSNATWFLHASRHMILNGSSKNPDMRPTKLTLSEITEILSRSLKEEK